MRILCFKEIREQLRSLGIAAAEVRRERVVAGVPGRRCRHKRLAFFVGCSHRAGSGWAVSDGGHKRCTGLVEVVLPALADIVDGGTDVLLAVDRTLLCQVAEHLNREAAVEVITGT